MCLIFTKKLQVQEGKGLAVPLRTSDCETIFSFLFLRGLEETSQSLEPRLWCEHSGMESRITPSPPPPFHLTVIFYCCYSAAFYTPENHKLSKQIGRCWQPQMKNTMAGRRLWREDGDWMGRRGCPWNPCMGKTRKIGCKGKRTNNPITESKTEVGTHISIGGIVCPSQNWASLHVMNSLSAFPLQVLLIPKTLHSMYAAVSLLIAAFSLTQTIKK